MRNVRRTIEKKTMFMRSLKEFLAHYLAGIKPWQRGVKKNTVYRWKLFVEKRGHGGGAYKLNLTVRELKESRFHFAPLVKRTGHVYLCGPFTA